MYTPNASLSDQISFGLIELLTIKGAISNLRKRINRLKFAREKIYEKPHLCRKTSEKK